MIISKIKQMFLCGTIALLIAIPSANAAKILEGKWLAYWGHAKKEYKNSTKHPLNRNRGLKKPGGISTGMDSALKKLLTAHKAYLDAGGEDKKIEAFEKQCENVIKIIKGLLKTWKTHENQLKRDEKASLKSSKNASSQKKKRQFEEKADYAKLRRTAISKLRQQGKQLSASLKKTKMKLAFIEETDEKGEVAFAELEEEVVDAKNFIASINKLDQTTNVTAYNNNIKQQSEDLLRDILEVKKIIDKVRKKYPGASSKALVENILGFRGVDEIDSFLEKAAGFYKGSESTIEQLVGLEPGAVDTNAQDALETNLQKFAALLKDMQQWIHHAEASRNL